jgi:hypothetical protein
MGKFLRESDRLVVLLHGAFRDASSMADFSDFFDQRDVPTLNIDYPSTEHTTLDKLADHVWGVIDQNERLVSRAREVDFVAHSMGGIVLRHMLDRHERELGKPGKVMMIGTPNQGSVLVNHLKTINFFYAGVMTMYFNMFGPAIRELSTDIQHPPIPKNHPVHIVSGNSGYDPNFPQLSAYLLNPAKILTGNFSDIAHDGVVTVESTKLPEMTSHATFPYAHTVLHHRPDVINHTARMLGLPAQNENFPSPDTRVA